MSIPSNFTSNGNCAGEPFGPGWGGMRKFCNVYYETPDLCEIRNQDDYNKYQIGCVNGWRGRFTDTNNNTVELKKSYGGEKLKKPVHFAVGSRDQYKLVYQDSFDPPYPLFFTENNCREIPHESPNYSFEIDKMCYWNPPTWAPNIDIPDNSCLIIDDNTKEYFKSECKSRYGRRFVENGDEPYKSDNGEYSFSTDYSSTSTENTEKNNESIISTSDQEYAAKTITVTKCFY